MKKKNIGESLTTKVSFQIDCCRWFKGKNKRQEGRKKKQSDEGVKKEWLQRRKNGQISASAFLV